MHSPETLSQDIAITEGHEREVEVCVKVIFIPATKEANEEIQEDLDTDIFCAPDIPPSASFP